MLPVDLICSAIATQEGWFNENPEVLPRQLNNPGDLRFAGQIGATAPGWNKIDLPPIATFPDSKHGMAALYRQVWRFVAEGLTLRQLIETWAPPSENNSGQYLRNVQEWTGLPTDTPILDLLPPLMPCART